MPRSQIIEDMMPVVPPGQYGSPQRPMMAGHGAYGSPGHQFAGNSFGSPPRAGFGSPAGYGGLPYPAASPAPAPAADLAAILQGFQQLSMQNQQMQERLALHEQRQAAQTTALVPSPRGRMNQSTASAQGVSPLGNGSPNSFHSATGANSAATNRTGNAGNDGNTGNTNRRSKRGRTNPN